MLGLRWRRSAFIGVLGAGFNGGSFLNYNENFSSMLMSVGSAQAASVCRPTHRQRRASDSTRLTSPVE